ncbi:MAG TPA: hypothetical protein VFE34_08995 [Dongiaceae bacterium]|jgi:hypothetical protein|nr:hypothetical protein [Dongiaceae bacterium]
MIISIVNHTNGQVSDEELQNVIRAINRQITEDFEPYWSLGATLRLEGRSEKKPGKLSLPDLRGDAILYLWNETDVDGALGYHENNASGIPYGFVFTDLSKKLGEPWSVTLSHEALELIADPEVNLLVMGPHPTNPNKTVFHWYEMSDAVQDETYEIDGVEVSNFVLPLYFTGSDETGARNDFLGRLHKGKTLQSFGVNPGGYIGYFDPELGGHATFSRTGDAVAAERMKVKGRAQLARRALRYRRFLDTPAAAKHHGKHTRAAALATAAAPKLTPRGKRGR